MRLASQGVSHPYNRPLDVPKQTIGARKKRFPTNLHEILYKMHGITILPLAF